MPWPSSPSWTPQVPSSSISDEALERLPSLSLSHTSRVRRQLSRVPGALSIARRLAEPFRVCMRYRVTGLASEAGFFTLLWLPPLILGLFGGVGYIGPLLGPGTVHQPVRGAGGRPPT